MYTVFEVIVMEFLSFQTYLHQVKHNFKSWRFERDLQYRSVLFHQFGERYRYYCRMHHYIDEYDRIAYDVQLYEQRIEAFRSA